MSLENEIEKLTVAVNRLTNAIEAKDLAGMRSATTPIAPATPIAPTTKAPAREEVEVDDTPKTEVPRRGRPPKATAAEKVEALAPVKAKPSVITAVATLTPARHAEILSAAQEVVEDFLNSIDEDEDKTAQVALLRKVIAPNGDKIKLKDVPVERAQEVLDGLRQIVVDYTALEDEAEEIEEDEL